MVAHDERDPNVEKARTKPRWEKSFFERLGTLALKIFRVGYYSGEVDEIDKVMFPFLRHAVQYVIIVAGELNDKFYTKPETKEALKDLRERGVKIEIVTGPDMSEKTKELILQLGLDLYQLEERPPIHFSLLDGRHVKLEEYHVPYQQKRRFYMKYNAPALAQSLEARFEDMKRKARRVVNSSDKAALSHEPR